MRTLEGFVLPRPSELIEGKVLLDVGAGLRPSGWYVPKKHICVEPHGPYAEVLRAHGFETNGKTAIEAMRGMDPGSVDCVHMLDVIEHMHREDGEMALHLALETARQQVVVFTPVGFMQQEHDAWNMGGEHWQKHRSGWDPSDFPGWFISYFGNAFIAVSP